MASACPLAPFCGWQGDRRYFKIGDTVFTGRQVSDEEFHSAGFKTIMVKNPFDNEPPAPYHISTACTVLEARVDIAASMGMSYRRVVLFGSGGRKLHNQQRLMDKAGDTLTVGMELRGGGVGRVKKTQKQGLKGGKKHQKATKKQDRARAKQNH